MTSPRPGLYAWHHGGGGVPFFRMREPLRAAKMHEFAPTGMGNRIDDEVCAEFDTIIAHMLWDERSSEAWSKLAKGGRHRLVLDVDDMMWRPDYAPFLDHYTPDVLKRVERNISMAHVVTTPSPVLAEFLYTLNHNVWVCPNYVPEWVTKLNPPPRPEPAGKNGIRYLAGYQGSPSHLPDFTPWVHAEISRFLDRCPEWGMHFWGYSATNESRPRWGFTPWFDRMRDYYMSLSMDIGIGPLKASPFNAGKSSLRAVEYAALGIPAILSAGPSYDDWVRPGETGLLIHKWDSWADALTMLAKDHDLRVQMSDNARVAGRRWTTEANASKWFDAWNSI